MTGEHYIVTPLGEELGPFWSYEQAFGYWFVREMSVDCEIVHATELPAAAKRALDRREFIHDVHSTIEMLGEVEMDFADPAFCLLNRAYMRADDESDWQAIQQEMCS